MSFHKPFTMLVAIFTSVTFLATGLGVSPGAFAAPVAAEVSLPYQAAIKRDLRLAIPQELGKLESFNPGSGTKPAIFHIQTAHGHDEAQQQIRKILHYLDAQYGVKTLLVEGSAFQLEPRLLNFFPKDPELTRKVNDALTKRALVKGPELYLLDKMLESEERQAEDGKPATDYSPNSNPLKQSGDWGSPSYPYRKENQNQSRQQTTDRRKIADSKLRSPVSGLRSDGSAVKAFGIEKLEPYRENGLAFVEVLDHKEKTSRFLADMDMQIDRLAGRFLNKDLRDFLRRVEGFEKNRIPFDVWIKDLKREAEESLEINLASPAQQLDWPMMVRFFKMQELGARLDPQKLPKEREVFLKAVKRFLPGSLHGDIEQVLTSGQMSRQLPDPETGLLFEDMVKQLPENFNYDVFPNVRALAGTLLLQSELKAEGLLKETKVLSTAIAGKLTRDQRERQLVALLADHRLLQKLFALELMPEDYDAILARSVELGVLVGGSLKPSNIVKSFESAMLQSSSPPQIVGRIRPSADSIRGVKTVQFSHMEELDALYEKAMKFYAGAKERDGAMEQRIEERLRETGANKVAVITGGFHSGPFKVYFSSRDFPYALISPKLSSADAAGHAAYENNMMRFAGNGERGSVEVPSTSVERGAWSAKAATLESEFLSDPQVLSGTYAIDAGAMRAEIRRVIGEVDGRAVPVLDNSRSGMSLNSVDSKTLRASPDTSSKARMAGRWVLRGVAFAVFAAMLGIAACAHPPKDPPKPVNLRNDQIVRPPEIVKPPDIKTPTFPAPRPRSQLTAPTMSLVSSRSGMRLNSVDSSTPQPAAEEIRREEVRGDQTQDLRLQTAVKAQGVSSTSVVSSLPSVDSADAVRSEVREVENPRTAIANVLGAIALSMALAGFWGWFFDINVLKVIFPSLDDMKANGAISLILASVALNFFLGAFLLKARVQKEQGRIMLEASDRELAASELKFREMKEESAEIIKELKENQELLRQQDRWATLGTLIAGLTHELNNPIAIMEGLVDFAGRALASGDTALAEGDLRSIWENLRRIRKIVQDLIISVRPDAVAANRSVFPISRAIHMALDLSDVAIRSGQVGLTIQTDEALRIYGDEDRIVQAFVNLIKNAMDAPNGEADKHITLVASGFVGEDGKKLIRVAVRDNGLGADSTEGWFDPFFTTKDRSERAGMGLSLAKSFIEEVGGSIKVNSAVGKGTTFEILIPQATESGMGAADQDADSVAQGIPGREVRQIRKILVVDDEISVRMLCEGYLQEAGYEVVSAENGQKALDLLDQQDHRDRPFDLVITDYSMPLMNGAVFARGFRIRERRGSAKEKTPIVMMTGHDGGPEFDKAKELQTQGVLDVVESKILSAEFLNALVERMKRMTLSTVDERGFTEITQAHENGSAGSAVTAKEGATSSDEPQWVLMDGRLCHDINNVLGGLMAVSVLVIPGGEETLKDANALVSRILKKNSAAEAITKANAAHSESEAAELLEKVIQAYQGVLSDGEKIIDLLKGLEALPIDDEAKKFLGMIYEAPERLRALIEPFLKEARERHAAWIALQLEAPASESASLVVASQPASSNVIRVLFAVDDESLSELFPVLMQMALKSSGSLFQLEVVTAKSGEEALEAVMTNGISFFDGVIVDNNFKANGKISGLDVGKTLRKEQYKGLLILMSGETHEGTEKWFSKAIVKQFGRDDLRKLILEPLVAQKERELVAAAEISRSEARSNPVDFSTPQPAAEEIRRAEVRLSRTVRDLVNDEAVRTAAELYLMAYERDIFLSDAEVSFLEGLSLWDKREIWDEASDGLKNERMALAEAILKRMGTRGFDEIVSHAATPAGAIRAIERKLVKPFFDTQTEWRGLNAWAIIPSSMEKESLAHHLYLFRHRSELRQTTALWVWVREAVAHGAWFMGGPLLVVLWRLGRHGVRNILLEMTYSPSPWLQRRSRSALSKNPSSLISLLDEHGTEDRVFDAATSLIVSGDVPSSGAIVHVLMAIRFRDVRNLPRLTAVLPSVWFRVPESDVDLWTGIVKRVLADERNKLAMPQVPRDEDSAQARIALLDDASRQLSERATQINRSEVRGDQTRDFRLKTDVKAEGERSRSAVSSLPSVVSGVTARSEVRRAIAGERGTGNAIVSRSSRDVSRGEAARAEVRTLPAIMEIDMGSVERLMRWFRTGLVPLRVVFSISREKALALMARLGIHPETAVKLRDHLTPEDVRLLEEVGARSLAIVHDQNDKTRAGGVVFMDEEGLMNFAKNDSVGFYNMLKELAGERLSERPILTAGDAGTIRRIAQVLLNKNSGLALNKTQTLQLLDQVVKVEPLKGDRAATINGLADARHGGMVTVLSSEEMLAGLHDGANFAFKDSLAKENVKLVLRALFGRMRVLAAQLDGASTIERVKLLEEFNTRQVGGLKKIAGGFVFDNILHLVQSFLAQERATAKSA